MTSREYDQGYRAYGDNIGSFNNPYPEESQAAYDWDLGYSDAGADDDEHEVIA